MSDALTGQTVELLQQMIRNQCVNDGTVASGQEVRTTDLLRTFFQCSGLDLEVYEPEGAYYVMTDVKGFGATDDTEFVRWLIQSVGVAAVPGSSFYQPRDLGRTKVRFMFAKKDETLHQAGERLLRVRELRG